MSGTGLSGRGIWLSHKNTKREIESVHENAHEAISSDVGRSTMLH